MTTIVLYCSSSAEYARADYTDPSDVARSVTDPFWEGKSSMRWLTYLAHHFALGIAGENPGFGDSTNYTDQPAVLGEQARRGGWSAAYLAHDAQLWDGTLTLAGFVAAVKP